MAESILEQTQKIYDSLRPSEQKIAKLVLRSPDKVVEMKLKDLAQEAAVSDPTIARFCKALGLDGYKELRLKLARSTQPSTTYDRAPIGPRDSLTSLRDKIFNSALGVLNEVREEIELDALEQAIHLLSHARCVELFAFGGSVPIAMDFQHKLFRLQVMSSVYSDPHLQSMAACSLQKDDLVFAFSNSGTTEALVRSIEVVRKAGLPVLAITPSNTPLAELANVALCVDPDDSGLLMMPLSARLAWLAIIDILVLGVAQKRGPEGQKHLNNLLQNQQQFRLNKKNKKTDPLL
ncbi:MAG: MurR/RpiR family transcriptional regulator [Gammaproteobacteria bacterium]